MVKKELTDPCAVVLCPVGYICKVDEATGKPFCDPSCELKNGGCAANEKCTLVEVQCITTPCPPIIKCIPPHG